MRLKKTLFSIETEFTVDELRQIYYTASLPVSMRIGFLIWIQQTFGLDLHPRLPHKKEEGHATK